MKTATLALLLFLIPVACVSTTPDGQQPSGLDTAMRYLEAVGDGIVRVEGTAVLQKYAPQAMPIFDFRGKPLLDAAGNQMLDANGKPMETGDGIITMAEVRAVVNINDPMSITFVTMMAIEVYRERQAKRKAGQ